MTVFRPEATALLRRWAEPALAAAATLAGLWLAARGGFFFLPLGLSLAALGAGATLLALRRLRFAADPGAPGLVELDEGRLRYLHPVLAGDIALPDLAELHLTQYRGRKVWRLIDTSGHGLMIPLDASGAPALFDAFAALPGLSTADLVAALTPAPPGQPSGQSSGPGLSPALLDRKVWTRPGAAVISFRDRTAGRT